MFKFPNKEINNLRVVYGKVAVNLEKLYLLTLDSSSRKDTK